MFNLYSVARNVVKGALMMGGSDANFYKATFCPYVKDDGMPCYDERSGSPYIECPICSGKGVIYLPPIPVKVIYNDQSNPFIADKSGGWIKGQKTLTYDPTVINPDVLKERKEDSARRLLRDRFHLLGNCCDERGKRKVVETLYVLEQPVLSAVNSGIIVGTIKVGNNY
jgi:hypothetical protein